MAKRERSTLQKVLRVLVVLLLMTLLGLAAYSQFVGQTFLPENALASVISPVQGFFSSVADSAVSYIARIKLRSNIEYEYNRLRAENEQLLYRALLAEELQRNNEQLLNLLGEYNRSLPMNPLHARVIDSEPGNWFSVFMLNKGTNDGVSTNMAVVTPQGLVGNIVEVYSNSCKVISVIDSNFSIAAYLASSSDQGIVRGARGMDGQALCRMYYLPTTSVPRPGDTVRTSGVGLAFPKGITIGTVRESTRSLEENKYYIVVEPTVDFQHIEDVLILRYEAEAEALTRTEDEGELTIMAPPTTRPQPTIQDFANVTPAPIPGAPGRATPTPDPLAVEPTNEPPLEQPLEPGTAPPDDGGGEDALLQQPG